MSTIYSRRQAIEKGLGSLAGLSVLGLAGCETGNPTPSQNAIVLRMVFWGSTTRNTLTREAIDLFQKSYPNVTITSQYTGDNLYWNMLNAQIAAGKTPDLIQMDMRFVAQYVRKGLLLDLNQLIYNQTIDLTDFDPLLLSSSKVNNGVYGIPLGGNYQSMYYDQVLLENAGVGPLPANMTWDTFAEYVTELSKASNYSVYGTPDNSGDITNFELWVRSHGKELYTFDGKLDFELANVVDWYSYWSNLRTTGGCLPTRVQVNLDNTNTPSDASIIKGNAIFHSYYSNTFQAFQSATSHPLGITMPPNGSTPGMYLKTSQMLSIAASTQYISEAANFTSFIINNAGAVIDLGIERGMPGSAQALALLNHHFTPVQQKIALYVNMVAKSGNTRVKEVLDPPGAGQVATLLKNISQEIGLGKTSVIDGAKTFYAGAQKALL